MEGSIVGWSYYYGRPRAEVHRELYGTEPPPTRRGLRAYSNYVRPLVTVKKYPLEIPTPVVPYLWEWSSRQSGRATITWDTDKTSVIGSVLVISVVSSKDPTSFFAELNGALVGQLRWNEGEKGTEKQIVADVSIANGTNLVEVYGKKEAYIYLGEVRFYIKDAYLEVSFEGEAPKRPQGELIKEWLEAHWVETLIICSVGAVVGTVVYKVAR